MSHQYRHFCVLDYVKDMRVLCFSSTVVNMFAIASRTLCIYISVLPILVLEWFIIQQKIGAA